MRPVRAWTQTTGPFFFAASSLAGSNPASVTSVKHRFCSPPSTSCTFVLQPPSASPPTHLGRRGSLRTWQRAGGVVERGVNRRFDLFFQSVGNEAVVDGDDGNAGFEERIGIGKTIQAFLGAALPPSTMNNKDKKGKQ